MGEAEARSFLLGWQNYLRHYSIAATQKTVDLVTACGVTVFLYAPRIVAFNRRHDRPRMGHNGGPPMGPAQVFQFHPPQSQSHPGNGQDGPPLAGADAVLAEGPPDTGELMH